MTPALTQELPGNPTTPKGLRLEKVLAWCPITNYTGRAEITSK